MAGLHLMQELARHADSSRKFIALHDTATFGDKGKDGTMGLKWGIGQFLKTNKHWWVKLNLPHNNGLTVMERHRL